jgi:ketosteroid isomerase-like protein
MKQFSMYFLLLTGTAFLATGCSNNTATTATVKDSTVTFDPSSVKKTIEEGNKEFAKAFTGGDSAAMVNHYTEDGKIFPPNADAVIGRAAISALVSEFLKFGIKEFRDETTALYGTEENLVEEGNYFMGDGKGTTLDKGKYICIWRKVNGVWKVYSDIFNTSLPPAPVKK